MALNFPDSPVLNQVYTDTTSGFSYKWNGTLWQSYSPSASSEINVLDDISGSFNGSSTIFNLTLSGTAFTSANAQQLRVTLGGIVQEPGTDYSVASDGIIFTTPPSSGLTCSIVSLGPAVPVDAPNSGNIFTRQEYNPTSSQSSFTVTNGYTVGYLNVYRNGVKLVDGTDFTATDGSTFTLTTASESGDVVESIAYHQTSLYTLGAFANDLTVLGNANVTGILTATSFVGDGSNLTGLSTFSGDYNDLTNKPSIPSDTGDLTNNVGFITATSSGSSLTGIVTSITAGSGISVDQSTGNVTITASGGGGGGGGSWTQVGIITANNSSNTIDFSSQMDDTYRVYKIFAYNVRPSLGGGFIWFRFYNGSTALSTGYAQTNINGTDTTWTSTYGTIFDSQLQNSTLYRNNFEMTLYNMGFSSQASIDLNGNQIYSDGTNLHFYSVGRSFYRYSSSDYTTDGIRIFSSSGNFAQGVFILYGIN